MWTSLLHNGIYFPPLYTPLPSNVKILYEGKPISLTLEQEEPAYLYAKYIGTEYVQSKRFNKNFFNDWKKILGKDSIVREFDKIDFLTVKPNESINLMPRKRSVN